MEGKKYLKMIPIDLVSLKNSKSSEIKYLKEKSCRLPFSPFFSNTNSQRILINPNVKGSEQWKKIDLNFDVVHSEAYKALSNKIVDLSEKRNKESKKISKEKEEKLKELRNIKKERRKAEIEIWEIGTQLWELKGKIVAEKEKMSIVGRILGVEEVVESQV